MSEGDGPTAATPPGRSAAGRRRWADASVASALGLAALAQSLALAFVALPRSDDLALFGADTARTVRHMAVRGPMLDRAQFHPLFPLLTQPPVRLLVLVGCTRFLAVRVVMGAAGAGLVVGVYAMARRRGLRPLEAAGPAAVVLVSAASAFFTAIPESFAVAAACVVWALFLVGSPGTIRPGAAVVALVVGPAAVLTGAVAPVLAVVRRVRPLRRLVGVVLVAGALAAVGVLVQRLVVGTRPSLTVGGEDEFLHGVTTSSVGASVRTVVLDMWAAPTPRLVGGVVSASQGGWWGGPWRGAAGLLVLAWLAVVAVGAAARRHDPVVVPVVVALAVHVVLHAAYGDEPFLYAALALPLVAALAVVAASGPFRRVVVSASWVLVPVLGVLSWTAVHRAGELLAT